MRFFKNSGVLAVLLLVVGVVNTAAASQPNHGAELGSSQRAAPIAGMVSGITFDTQSITDGYMRGSDNPASAWSDDDHQYTVWGDGTGFGTEGGGGPHRVGLGIGRIEGDYPSFDVFNVNGGVDNECNCSTWPADGDGKSWSIMALNGNLYIWWVPGGIGTVHDEAQIYKSTDKGETWSAATWSWVEDDDVTIPTFVNFGQDYADNTDGFVYSYFIHPSNPGSLSIQHPGIIYVGRAPVASEAFFTSDSNWEFWDGDSWDSNINNKAGVILDDEGVGWTQSAIYVPDLDVYVHVTEYDASPGGFRGGGSVRGKLRFRIAEAPEGPWKLLAEYENFAGRGAFEDGSTGTFWGGFSPKFMYPEYGNRGDFVFFFTGTGVNDDMITIEGSFTLSPETKEDCKNGGWQQFSDPPFKNQGDCVSYVATRDRPPGPR